MFDELQRLSQAAAVRFTLYVDDLCFSGARATPSFLWEAKKVVHRHGYAAQHRAGRHMAADQSTR